MNGHGTADGRRHQTGVSRRSVLAAATIAIVKPSAARSAAAAARIRLGVIGCGGRGHWIADLFRKHGGYELAAVADYFEKTAQRVGEALGVPANRRFSGLAGYRRLLDAGVDAVALETPPCFFPRHAQAAVAAGCHVYMAKPVACDVPGALSIRESGALATLKKRCFLVDFQIPTDPLWQEAVKRVHEGALGRIAMIGSYYTDESFPDPPRSDTIEGRLHSLIWCNDIDIGGGYFVNAGIHAIQAAMWVAGGATPVAAVGMSRRGRRDPHGDSDDVFSISYEFADGLLLNHRGEHIQNMHGFTAGLQAWGQGAYMEGNYDGKTWLRGGPKGFAGGEVRGLYGAGAQRNIAEFHRAITDGDFTNRTVADGVNSTLACILGRDAARAKSRLTWDEMLRANRAIEVNLRGLAE